MDLTGDSDLPDRFFKDLVLHGGSLSGVYVLDRRLRADDACGRLWDPALFGADISAGDLLRVVRLSSMDHGRGNGGWKREKQIMDDVRFYGTWNCIRDIYKS